MTNKVAIDTAISKRISADHFGTPWIKDYRELTLLVFRLGCAVAEGVGLYRYKFGSQRLAM
jgi:hypothetical protein